MLTPKDFADETLQIEQWIESIFPTQDIKKMSAEEQLKARQRNEEQSVDTMEAMWLILAVLIVLSMVGGLMVCFGPLPSHQIQVFLAFRIIQRNISDVLPTDRNSVVHGSQIRQDSREISTRTQLGHKHRRVAWRVSSRGIVILSQRFGAEWPGKTRMTDTTQGMGMVAGYRLLRCTQAITYHVLDWTGRFDHILT